MQVSLTATGGLERRLEVAIPAAEIDGEVAQRLTKISRTVRLKGFRPGKAPIAVIRQQYGDQIHGEVINDLMRSSFSEAVAREKLNPAGGPRIEPIAVSPGSDLKYAAVFEVLPEVHLKPVSDLTIEKPVASVGESDLEAMLDTLRKQRPAFNEVTRGAAANDRVTVDFTGTIDGVEFEGGSGTQVPIVIGAGRVMKEFEDALLGAQAGDSREFKATFAGDHANPKLAGQQATFSVKIGKVEEQSPAPLDEDFRQELWHRGRQSRQPARRSARQHGARAQRSDSPEDARPGPRRPVHAEPARITAATRRGDHPGIAGGNVASRRGA